ncbi:MAG: hypothetical protein CM1200mP30_22180 [Pseudomonadota bacterium]|nr:MAG: hypothetical protein CM1200mP30_22180 [Pseudomonadota bacterium]
MECGFVKIREKIEKISKTKFNSFLNEFIPVRSRQCIMASDDEPELGQNP